MNLVNGDDEMNGNLKYLCLILLAGASQGVAQTLPPAFSTHQVDVFKDNMALSNAWGDFDNDGDHFSEIITAGTVLSGADHCVQWADFDGAVTVEVTFLISEGRPTQKITNIDPADFVGKVLQIKQK